MCGDNERNLNLKWKMTLALKGKGNMYTCTKCGKMFGDAGNFKRHDNLVHEGLKKFICYNCGRAFGERTKLKNHIKAVHEGTQIRNLW